MGGFDSSPAMTRPSDLQESQLSGIPFVPLYMPFNNHSNFDLDKDFKSSGVGFVEYFLTEDDAAQCTLPSEFLAVEGPLPFLQINNTLSAKCGYTIGPGNQQGAQAEVVEFIERNFRGMHFDANDALPWVDGSPREVILQNVTALVPLKHETLWGYRDSQRPVGNNGFPLPYGSEDISYDASMHNFQTQGNQIQEVTPAAEKGRCYFQTCATRIGPKRWPVGRGYKDNTYNDSPSNRIKRARGRSKANLTTLSAEPIQRGQAQQIPMEMTMAEHTGCCLQLMNIPVITTIEDVLDSIRFVGRIFWSEMRVENHYWRPLNKIATIVFATHNEAANLWRIGNGQLSQGFRLLDERVDVTWDSSRLSGDLDDPWETRFIKLRGPAQICNIDWVRIQSNHIWDFESYRELKSCVVEDDVPGFQNLYLEFSGILDGSRPFRRMMQTSKAMSALQIVWITDPCDVVWSW